MKQYYLLEHKENFFPDNTYELLVTDKHFLNSVKKLKKNKKNKDLKIPVFVSANRGMIDSYDENFKEEDMYDELGFNVFFGMYGDLTIVNYKENIYQFKCKGIAEVHSGLYSDKYVEHLDIIPKKVIKNEKTEEKVFKQLESMFKEYLKKENINISYNKTTDLEKFINKNINYFPVDNFIKKRILYVLDLEKKAQLLMKSIEIYVRANQYKNEIDNKVRINIDNQQKEYFLREQMKVVQEELRHISPEDDDIEKLKQDILNLKLSKNDEGLLLKEIDRLEKTPVMSPEHSIIRTYLETVISLPWNDFTEDSIDINQSEKILNRDHYGLEKIKERILEFLAVKKLKNDMKSPILCLSGPPGVGKSSLAKSIAEAMNRNFVRVSLGGVRDEAEIRGHRRTYVGALPGKIIQSIKKVKSKNPVILLDEIDKMASDIKGDPAAAMLEVIDPEQNNEFVDHYMDIPFDLSNVLFIATANNLSAIPTPLRDRMEVIELSSYTVKEKENIASKYLIPKQIKENGLTKKQITFTKQSIIKIINNYTYEAGVRNLDRTIGAICRKSALKILQGEDKVKIGVVNIELLLGPEIYSEKEVSKLPEIGLVNGLAYTALGGDTLDIETSISKGNGKIILTGKLGDIMKESAQTAISFLRSNAESLKISDIDFSSIDIHLHVPEGAVPKDGPSAGITITTSLYSSLAKKAVDNNIAMTGEMTLHGKVLPIGGVKEKLLSSEKMNIRKIILPEKNKKDLVDIPKEILDKLDINFVNNIYDVFNIVFGEI